MNEEKITELKDKILERVAGGEEGDYQILSKCCNKPLETRWGGGGAWMFLACSGCGKKDPEIIVIE